ncbi:MAG: hypothetical protein JXR70_02285 [Spirochaetales bacterium]|nr:hypothetical protein [Spirochaetales bacterium]
MKIEQLDYKLSEIEKKSLENKTYFFGHQSVGFNIIDGMTAILNENKTEFNIIEIKNNKTISKPEKGTFLHAVMDENFYPLKKIDNFNAILTKEPLNQLDVAMLKFCYVDITTDGDINELFKEYTSTIANLENKYPNTKFIYITTPLVAPDIDFIATSKNFLKGILGKSKWGYEDNLKRNEFNNLLRKNYSQTGRLFDLAFYESKLEDGTRNSVRYKNTEIFTMLPQYTNDGGHLNELGKKNMAYYFLKFLAQL